MMFVNFTFYINFGFTIDDFGVLRRFPDPGFNISPVTTILTVDTDEKS